MNPSHFFIALILIASSFFLFLGGPGDFASRSVRELWNLGHIAYFALLTHQLISWGVLKKFSLPMQWVMYLVMTLVLGTSIELLQYGTQRSPDVGDISRDLIGSALVLAFTPGLLVLSSEKSVRAIRLLVLVFMVMHLLPLTRASIDELNACVRFPVISDFETPFELDRWKGSAGRDVVSLESGKNEHQMKVRFGTDVYSSASMQYLAHDWSDYATLNLRIFQPDPEPLRITIRIHDELHETAAEPYQYSDRFNRRFILQQGWNDIVIALSEVRLAAAKRQIELNKIRNINLFSSRLSEAREAYLETVFLAK